MNRIDILNKYNKGSLFEFKPSEDFEYHTLEDRYNTNGSETIYKVNALYINKKGKFGDSGVVATDTEFLNLPNHLTGTIKDMLNDTELIQMINEGCVGLQIYKYHSNSYNKDCYSINWVMIEPNSSIPF